MTCRGDGRASRTGPGRSLRRDGVTGAFALICVMACTVSHACGRPLGGIDPFAVASLRLENDWFGGSGQDRGYTSGLQISAMTSDLNRVANPDCLPALVRGIGRTLGWLHPQGPDRVHVEVGLGQGLFTPSDRAATDPIPGDRPYAAVLLLSAGYIARNGEDWSTSHLRVGIAGPSALGEQVQNGAHRVFGGVSWSGWGHQLRDEPVFQLVHQRLRHWGPWPTPGGWRQDLIGHWGASLGNLATYANAGFEWRLGPHLPDDFGSHPRRPAGVQLSQAPQERSQDGWDYHFFLSVDARAVAHNITLDGNSWKRSHSVDKRAFVADLGLGMTVRKGLWQVTFARYNRTREFSGQQLRPVFGSITISRHF